MGTGGRRAFWRRMGTTFGGVAPLGSSRFAAWTCIAPKHPTTIDPVCAQFRVSIMTPTRVLTAVSVRPRRTSTFHLATAPFGFGDAFAITSDRGRALVVWTQRSSRGRKGEREIRSLVLAASTRKAPVPKLLGRIPRTASLDVATAPDGRAVALVVGSVKGCGPAAGSGDARYAAAAVRAHGRWGSLQRITCEADARTMEVAGTARGFLADWFRTSSSVAGFRGAVTISTFR